MQLQQGTILQNGEYTIVKHLGQGGFGITYLAERKIIIQGKFGVVKSTAKVTIKEFFMKEFCNRDADTSYVSVPSVGSKVMVNKFKHKFVKEAQNIAKLDHDNIIKVLDIFEENGTAYYVMEYIDGGSLADRIKEYGVMSEMEVLHYIRQIADALRYIHDKSINHLDVKPANILLKTGAVSVLIDFGLAKQYDSSGDQTSSTPVGVSKGYAPMEQYKSGGVSSFSPATDIYSLGATLYKLVTGITPPEAYDIAENGISKFPQSLSASTKRTIESSMQFLRSARPQSIAEFLEMLDDNTTTSDSESTAIITETHPHYKSDEETQHIESKVITPNPIKSEVKQVTPIVKKTPTFPRGEEVMKLILVVLAVLALIIGATLYTYTSNSYRGIAAESDSIYVAQTAPVAVIEAEPAPVPTPAVDDVTELYIPMVYVKGGTFRMGSDDSDAYDSEQPVHCVTLDSYYIGKYEVTQQQWREVIGSNPSRFKGDNKPVECVSWYGCVNFCNALSRKNGLQECYDINREDVTFLRGKNGYRLPTEAEWEYAARGGNKSRGYKYSGSNSIECVAWIDSNTGDAPSSVGVKKANELGIYDMSGNVCEWCWDWYGNYDSNSRSNPAGASMGSSRVIRGGNYYFGAWNCRSSYRDYYTPIKNYNNIGLRLVRCP